MASRKKTFLGGTVDPGWFFVCQRRPQRSRHLVHNLLFQHAGRNVRQDTLGEEIRTQSCDGTPGASLRQLLERAALPRESRVWKETLGEAFEERGAVPCADVRAEAARGTANLSDVHSIHALPGDPKRRREIH